VYPFERFNAASKRVLTLAQGEAERVDTSYIGTEHMLIALARESNTVAGEVLHRLNVELETVRTMVLSYRARAAEQPVAVQQIVPTARVKTVIEIAFAEARQMDDRFVGTEHLLLGLVVEGEGIAAHVLQDLGASLEKVREAIASVRTDEEIREREEVREYSTRIGPVRGHPTAGAGGGLRFVLLQRIGATSADSGPVYVNPADVVAVAHVRDDQTAITLRHGESSTLLVHGSAAEIARQLEDA
jgi:ATP-dependent Clp protease ATP-binding subunit ClpA